MILLFNATPTPFHKAAKIACTILPSQVQMSHTLCSRQAFCMENKKNSTAASSDANAMSSGSSAQVEAVVRLQILDQVSKDLEGEEVKKLGSKATEAVSQLQDVVMKNSNRCTNKKMARLMEMVNGKKWLRADSAFDNLICLNRSCDNINKVVKEIVTLAINDSDCLSKVIKWSGKQSGNAKRALYQEIHQQIQLADHTYHPQVLMLWKRVSYLPEGVLDDVRAQLNAAYLDIFQRIVDGIKQKDFSFSAKVENGTLCALMENIVPQVITADCDLNSTLLLIQLSVQLPTVSSCHHLLYALQKELDARDLLASEQALHMYAHANFIQMRPLLDKLTKYKPAYFAHYQRYVEDPDRLKIVRMHGQNGHLQSVVSEFVSWYCNGDLDRVGRLLEVARAVSSKEVSRCILTQLHSEEKVDA